MITRKHAVLSTLHITPLTSRLLQDKGPDSEDAPKTGDWRDGVVVCDFAYGHWVRCRPLDGHDEPPADLKACIDHAVAAGCEWILFDRDEPAIEELPVHEWP